MPYIPEKNEECICTNPTHGGKLWQCGTGACKADMQKCNFPSCECKIPYYAYSLHNRVSFCGKKFNKLDNSTVRVTYG